MSEYFLTLMTSLLLLLKIVLSIHESIDLVKLVSHGYWYTQTTFESIYDCFVIVKISFDRDYNYIIWHFLIILWIEEHKHLIGTLNEIVTPFIIIYSNVVKYLRINALIWPKCLKKELIIFIFYSMYDVSTFDYKLTNCSYFISFFFFMIFLSLCFVILKAFVLFKVVIFVK